MRPDLHFTTRSQDAWRATASRPRVVLLHSSGASSRQWDVLRDSLQPQFDVYPLDLYGHGKQRAWTHARALTVHDEAALALPLLESVRGAHVVGHSYGAGVAMHLAIARPELVHSLALFEPVLFSMLTAEDPHGLGTCEVVDLAQKLRQRVAEGRAGAAAQTFVDYWARGPAWAGLSARQQQTVASRMPLVVQHFDALFSAPLPPEAAARLNMPMLVLAGAHSTAAALRVAELLRALLPDAQHATLPGIGHMGPVTHPHEVNALVQRFLASAAHVQSLAFVPQLSTAYGSGLRYPDISLP
jgi:pimeloyl-ACP methyl ester carboxylesterase